MIRKIFVSVVLSFILFDSVAQTQVIRGTEWECHVNSDGCLDRIVFNGNDTIPFFKSATNKGPSFYIVENGEEKVAAWKPDGNFRYRTEINGIECRLSYLEHKIIPLLRLK